jgi:hypothetical protein
MWKKLKHLFLNINKIVLYIISRERRFDFQHRPAGNWRASLKCADQPGQSTVVAKITSPLSTRMFSGEISKL